MSELQLENFDMNDQVFLCGLSYEHRSGFWCVDYAVSCVGGD